MDFSCCIQYNHEVLYVRTSAYTSTIMHSYIIYYRLILPLSALLLLSQLLECTDLAEWYTTMLKKVVSRQHSVAPNVTQSTACEATLVPYTA